MPAYLSNELAGTTTGLSVAAASGYKPNATAYQGRLKRMRATINLASQLTTDTLVLGNLPAGATFAFGVINSTVSLGSSTLALGITGTTGKYRAAAAFTTANTPTLFGLAAPAGADPLAAEENVFATIAGATLPASGTLVIDFYYSLPN